LLAGEKRNKRSSLKDLEENNNKQNKNEEIINIDMDNLKKMDENSLNKLKIKLSAQYRTTLFDNQINNNKIIFYKTLLEEYNTNLINYIKIRNSIVDKEIL